MIMAPQADKLVCTPRIRRNAANFNGDGRIARVLFHSAPCLRHFSLSPIQTNAAAILQIPRCAFAENSTAKCHNDSGTCHAKHRSERAAGSAQ
jgi:hypothetical protein